MLVRTAGVARRAVTGGYGHLPIAIDPSGMVENATLQVIPPAIEVDMYGATQPMRIMTVCTGNICRSPMAQIVLAAALETAGLTSATIVESTGISSEESGNPLDRRAAAVLIARGYELPQHSARQVTEADLRENDLVLAMTASHARALRSIAHRAGRYGIASGDELAERVVMFRSFDSQAPLVAAGGPESLLDVDDPWYGGPADFEQCLDQIEQAVPGVVEYALGVVEREVS